MGRAIFISLSLLVSAFFTATTFLIGTSNNTIIDIIDRLPLIFSPIRLTYVLLIMIFIGLGYYCIQAFKTHVSLIQTLLFIINSVLQVVAVYYWYYELTMYALLALIMLNVGLFVLYLTHSMQANQLKIRLPIAAWYSWTMFFTLITINYNMIAYEWAGFNLSDNLWAVIILTFGAAYSLHLRYHYYDRLAPLLFSAGYLGIIIANGVSQLFVSASTLFLIGVMIVGYFFIKKKRPLA
ncbi:MAG: hypothetical protein ABS882_11790 [Lysinibacillus sp.]